MKNLTTICAVVSIALLQFSCRKEITEGTAIKDTLYVKNGTANMPVYLHGNLESNVIVLLLHGGPGSSGLAYRDGQYAIDLEEKVVMAYWDQRGQGMSQGKGTEITVEEMVDDLVAVIQVIKHKYGANRSVFIYGHSWGGLLGSAFMVSGNKQQMVKGWIESNGAHDLPRLNIASIALYKKIAQEQISSGNSVEKWQAILNWANAVDTNNITDQISGEINEKGNEAEDLLDADGLLANPAEGGSIKNRSLDAWRSNLTGNATNDKLNAEIEVTALTKRLVNITQPCLFLFSKYDFIVPPQLGIDAFDAVSSTEKQLVIYQKSGHSPMNNEPKAYVSDILSFVNKYK